MRRVRLLFTLGVTCAAAAGFFSPLWFTGFVPVAAGLIWAAYDLVEVDDAKSSSTPQ